MSRKRLPARERSRAIVEATIDLFAREGFTRTTTSRIARAAGVSEALVFRHFPTKESLYRAVLESRIEEAENLLLVDASLPDLDDEAFFLRIATFALERVEREDAFLRLLLHSALEDHDLAGPFRDARMGRLLELIETRIRTINREGRARGGRGASSGPLSARAFHGMILATLLNRHIFHDPVVSRAPVGRLARELVRIFLHGVRSEKEAS